MALVIGVHHLLGEADRTPGRHLTGRPRPDEDQEGAGTALTGPWNPAHSAASRDGPTHDHVEQTGRNTKPINDRNPLTNRG
jgi:hypothetical protein